MYIPRPPHKGFTLHDGIKTYAMRTIETALKLISSYYRVRSSIERWKTRRADLYIFPGGTRAKGKRQLPRVLGADVRLLPQVTIYYRYLKSLPKLEHILSNVLRSHTSLALLPRRQRPNLSEPVKIRRSSFHCTLSVRIFLAFRIIPTIRQMFLKCYTC